MRQTYSWLRNGRQILLFANSTVCQVQVVATAPITQEGVGDAKIVASYEKTFLI